MGCIVHGVTKSRIPLSDFHFKSSRIKLMMEGESQQWGKDDFRKRWIKGKRKGKNTQKKISGRKRHCLGRSRTGRR